MATASQVTALIQSFRDNDRERFVSTAIQLAAHEAKLGHGAVAQEIRQMVDTIKAQAPHARIFSFPGSDNTELNELTIPSQPNEPLAQLVLPEKLLDRIRRILLEYRQRAKLQAYGMSPRRKVLLAGPPGTGKTMTARVLAAELHLPLYTVLMDKLVTKYMGESSAKLRQIFSCMKRQRGVYLFDEFDAIGGDRGRDNDVGEMRRVLNTFLQMLEQDGSESLIVAATNEVGMLDKALFRRFDDVLHYQNPDRDSVEALLRNTLGIFWNGPQDINLLLDAAAGLSHAEIAQACSDAVKGAILHDRAKTGEKDILQALRARHEKYGNI